MTNITTDNFDTDVLNRANEQLQKGNTLPTEIQKLVHAARTKGVEYKHIGADDVWQNDKIVSDGRISVDHEPNCSRATGIYNKKDEVFNELGPAMLAIMVEQVNKSSFLDYEVRQVEE